VTDTLSYSPAPTRSWRSYLVDLWSRREFAWFMAIGNLRARNASTALGIFWWVFNPLLLAGVYWLVFGILLPVSRDVAHLVLGIFVFEYTKSTMTGSSRSIINNSKLLVNLRFPRMVLPVSALMEAAVGFAASLVVFAVLTIPLDVSIRPAYLLLLVPAIALHTLFNLGLGAFAARLIVPFRDLDNLLPYLLRLWLYLSPIIYSLDRIPDRFLPYMVLNPMVPFLDVYRAAIIGDPLGENMLLYASVWTIVLLVGGVWMFVRQEGRMVKYL
jgi:teichoic acid transport system permease protein